MNHASVTILVVEDDQVDVKALKRAFRELKIANPIVEAVDGVEALEILRGQNGRIALQQPYLILLDLNMPRLDGIGFLEELRRDPALHAAVVFVLTTSTGEEDRISAYEKNVAGYVLKHSPGHSFLEAISMLEHYWRIVEFPVR